MGSSLVPSINSQENVLISPFLAIVINSNGLLDGLLRFSNMEQVGICTFDKEDIVRNPIISKILDRYSVSIPDKDIRQFGEVGDGGGELSALYQKFITPKNKSDISTMSNKGQEYNGSTDKFNN